MSGAEVRPDFGEVFKVIKRVTEACGVRVKGEPLISYKERDLEFSRTAANENEVRQGERLVFRAKHTGALSSAHVFEPGEWVEEVKRIDRETRRAGGSKGGNR